MKLLSFFLVLMASCGVQDGGSGEPVSPEVDVLLFEEVPEPEEVRWEEDSIVFED